MLLVKMGESAFGKSRPGSFEVETVMILLRSNEQPERSAASNLSVVGLFCIPFLYP